MKLDLRHTALALTTACALLLVAAAPASASSYSAATTGGTVTFTKTGQIPWVFDDLAPDPTGGCPDATLAVTTTDTSTGATTGTVNATISSTSRFFFGGTTATDHYLTVITGGSTVTGGSAGTWSHSGTSAGTISSLSLRLTIRIYTGGSTSCTPGTTPICTWTVTIHLSGDYTNGDIRHPAVSDTAFLTGASTGRLVLGGVCAAPFSTYSSSTVTVANLGIHITAH